MSERKFSEQELVRRSKLEKLIENNSNPYAVSKYVRTHSLKKLVDLFNGYEKDELATLKQSEISIAGRIKLYREAGSKAAFLNIEDQDSDIQVYVRQDEIGEEAFANFRELDLGDIVGFKGIMMKTNHGELSLRAKEYILLSKALRPLPDKYAGIQDIEEKYRRRYVDLITNPESKRIFQARTKIIRTMQKILDERGYMEVETPILHSVKGGAAAKPFITHYNALDVDVYLRIATELHLKRLIVGGFDGVYEIGRIFRNEGMSTRHNPEFTSLELYVAYEDMFFLMDLTEEVFRKCNAAVNDSSIIEYGGHKLDLSKPFKRLHMVDGIKQVTGVDFWKEMTVEEALELAKKHSVHVEKHNYTVGHIINLFYEEFVEATIIEPTFVYGHPKEISPLSKSNAEDSRFTDRFELFILGREYANAFSELNDPIDQYDRFNEQIKEAAAGNDEATEMDIDFIEALEHAMPPTAGIGFGIDRLVMLLTNSESIKDVLLFPQLKPRD
ncbi:Lysyl-tRNA synthetase (class II) [Mesoplasma florum W37]|uniref:Lysine--tRNA ligase n=1 Tax=Mesoplasma florum TaxID=2151 RepID=A0AAD0HRS3_MESFO|nr:lysine--tRNA ligase [Mesoplasma florum]AGY41094.1 Lysyl-tRNA synthetase (class II) [Mesoplasma florum W37]AVN59327.1 lysine--tRNA ligase [Mesoplasma florum]AVN65432.1 Lysyl-tRNA synthetase (class II) [Mesoplasma florum]